MATPSVAHAALPTDLSNLSEEEQERLRTRQQQELSTSGTRQEQAIEALGAYRKIIHFLILQCICDVVFSVLLYLKLTPSIADGDDMSYKTLLSPLWTREGISILSSCYMLRHLMSAARYDKNKVIPQITHLLNAAAKICFYWLLVLKLSSTAHQGWTFNKGIFLPYWIYLSIDATNKLLFYRPLVKTKEVDAHGQPIMRVAGLYDVLYILITEHGCWFSLYYSIGKKLDGNDEESWVECFLVLYGLIAFLYCLILMFSLIFLTTDVGSSRYVLITGLCGCFLPVVVIATIFITFLAHNLDGKTHYSNTTLFGLLIAYEIFVSFGVVVLTLAMGAYLEHQEEEQRVMAGMQRHGRANTAATSSDARTQMREEAEDNLVETTKRVILVRETSSLFRRMASGHHGIDIDALSPSLPPSPPTEAASPGTPTADGTADDSTAAEGDSGDSTHSSHDKTCSICMESPRSAVLQPCGHGGFCYECGKIMASRRTKCPLCRTAIEEVLHYDAESATATEVVADRGASRASEANDEAIV
jgi:hypothetical protein